MRAATRALAVLSFGSAIVLSGGTSALAVHCPTGTYPPGQHCAFTGGTDGQVSSTGGSTGSTGSSSGSTSTGSTSTTGSTVEPTAAPTPGITEPEPVESPAPVATAGGTTGGTTGNTQAGGITKDAGSMSPMSYAVGGAGLILLLGVLVFLLARRRQSGTHAAS